MSELIKGFIVFINSQPDTREIEQESGWRHCAIGHHCRPDEEIKSYSDFLDVLDDNMQPLLDDLKELTPVFYEDLNDAGNTETLPTYATMKVYVNEAPELAMYANDLTYSWANPST